LRAELFMETPGKDRTLGVCEIPFRFGFDGTFRKLPAILAGPFVSLATSQNPMKLRYPSDDGTPSSERERERTLLSGQRTHERAHHPRFRTTPR